MIEEDEITETVQKRRGCILIIGPPIVLLIFSNAMSAVVLTDLIVYRTCLVSLNVNATDCLMLRTNSSSPEAMDLETRVAPYASMIVMTKSQLENVLPGGLSLFLGPWSDRGGRRPLLLATYIGFASEFAILSFMCTWNISPWYLMSALILSNISGGTTVVRLASTCYMADMTAEKDRRVQFILLEGSIFTGVVLGSVSGSLIYEHYGYANVFRTAAICCILAVVFTFFFIPESVKDTSKKSIDGFKISSFAKFFFTKSSVKDKSLHRFIVWLTIFLLTLDLSTAKGYETTLFRFTRARLGWDVQQYSYFNAIRTVLIIIGLCVASLLSRHSGVPDTLIAGVGLLSGLGCALTESFAWQSWHMYLAVSIGIFDKIVNPVIRSVLSNFIPKQDFGKAFSLLALPQLLLLFAGTPLFALIYAHYLPPIYPSPVYFITATSYILSMIGLICIEILMRKSRELQTVIAAAPQADF